MSGMNMATWDRVLRAIVGAVAIGVVLLGVVAGWLQIVLAVVAVILMGTSLVGFCPLYALLGLNTRRTRHGGIAHP